MILSKFYPGFIDYYTPADAAKDWTFTGVAGDPEPKYLVWQSINSKKMEFVWRSWVWTPYQLCPDPVTGEKDLMINIVKKYISDPNYGIVFKVITLLGNQHWVAGIGKSTLGWAANDPWMGVRLWALPLPYRRIDGFALIKRN